MMCLIHTLIRGINNRRQTGGLQQSAAASVARARRTLQAQKQFQK